eukprot:4921939-Pyramimonas_sp.AAC.1
MSCKPQEVLIMNIPWWAYRRARTLSHCLRVQPRASTPPWPGTYLPERPGPRQRLAPRPARAVGELD